MNISDDSSNEKSKLVSDIGEEEGYNVEEEDSDLEEIKLQIIVK